MRGSSRSIWRRATARSSSRIALILGALLVVAGIVTTAVLVSAPRPSATLQLTAAEPDATVRGLIEEEVWYEIDPSTLRAYESYRGWELWSAVSGFGTPCLLAIHPTGVGLRSACTPTSGELFVDSFPLAVPDGGIIRFVVRGESVDVYVHPGRRPTDE